MAHGTRQWMGQLKDQGIQLYILSGHGTERWQEHLDACQTPSKTSFPKNILFLIKLTMTPHKHKNHYHHPTATIWFTDKNIAASPFKVAMIGDGQNDERAMAQADAICDQKCSKPQ